MPGIGVSLGLFQNLKTSSSAWFGYLEGDVKLSLFEDVRRIENNGDVTAMTLRSSHSGCLEIGVRVAIENVAGQTQFLAQRALFRFGVHDDG